MKIEKSKGNILFEFKNGVMINLWQTITEIFTWKKYNWNIWQFINIEFEKDTMLGAYEFTFVFMLCGIRIRIQVPNEKSKKEWSKLNNAMKKIHESCYGWINENSYEKFRKKEIENLKVTRKRTKKNRKKIFIQ